MHNTSFAGISSVVSIWVISPCIKQRNTSELVAPLTIAEYEDTVVRMAVTKFSEPVYTLFLVMLCSPLLHQV